jgi:hypothetical protein
LHYNYSFCNDIGPYKAELKFLDLFLQDKNIIIPNAKALPYSFSLSKNRNINAFFTNEKYFHMFNNYLQQKDKFLHYIKQFIPFDDNFLNFCLKNQNVQGAWNRSILFFLLNYCSNKIDSFDGPFEENVDFDSINEHLKTLNVFNKRRLKIKLGQPTGVEGTRLYEFPDKNTQFIKNSFVITDRIIPSLGLIFEDKLKIYGV